jgi:hypothetical protein
MVLQREWSTFFLVRCKDCGGHGLKSRSDIMVQDNGHMSVARKTHSIGRHDDHEYSKMLTIIKA